MKLIQTNIRRLLSSFTKKTDNYELNSEEDNCNFLNELLTDQIYLSDYYYLSSRRCSSGKITTISKDLHGIDSSNMEKSLDINHKNIIPKKIKIYKRTRSKGDYINYPFYSCKK